MKRSIQVALGATFLSILAHLYLTMHYYPLKLGFAAGQSLCNINAKFDCDAVSVSDYSALLGIPLSVWGIAFNAVLFLMILLSWLEWSEHPERLRRWTLAFAGVSVLASLAMGGISLALMSNYCLFCIALYFLSFITFFAYKMNLQEPFWLHARRDLPKLWSESRGVLAGAVAIPLFAYMIHQMFMQNLSGGRLTREVQEAVEAWEVSPKQEFVAKPSLVMGPSQDSASLVLTEFADFLCGHCKRASYSLHAFVKAHPDVRFEFYSFPLDGMCNEKIQSASGLSCRLAAAVICAEQEGKGWPMHDRIFEKQEELHGVRSVAELDVILAKEVAPLGLNWESLQRCLDLPETLESLKAQSKQGALVDVRGTPTIYANGKVLSSGSLVPVLQAVHTKAIESRK